MEYRFTSTKIVLVRIVLLTIFLLAACERTQPGAEAPPLVYDPEEVLSDDFEFDTPVDEPSPTPYPGPSPTPGADEVGSGLIKILGYYEIRASTGSEDYMMGIDIPFKIAWNGEKQAWEAKGNSSRCSGIRNYVEGNCECNGLYEGRARMDAILIPPQTLIADPVGCKMVAHFSIDWDGFYMSCSPCDSVNVVPVSALLGPITINLVEGDRTTDTASPYFDTHTVVETFNFHLAELSLPERILCFSPTPEE